MKKIFLSLMTFSSLTVSAQFGAPRENPVVPSVVKDVVEDPDGYDGLPFTRFYADCIGSGTSIPWDDLL